MLSILNSPFPCSFGRKENFYSALLIGIFVALFLIIFEPFGISNSDYDGKILKTSGFGVVSFLVMLIYFFVIPRVFKKYFLEKNYTLGKDILASMGLILLVAMGNGLYAQFFLNQDVFGSVLVMVWQTFLVGIFPLTFLSLLQYNRKLNANLKASSEIEVSANRKSVAEIAIGTPQYFFISDDKDKKRIDLNGLLYLESDGNYAYLNQLNDGKATRTMHRTTLKSIEEENTFPNIIRCHRSYIVNLNQVTAVSGNAQGLKLSLKECEDIVPVSKKYIPVVKKYFS